MILRCTAKAQQLLGRPGPRAGSLEPGDDDWYVNLVWIDGRKCLLVTHAGTLFTVFVPDVRAPALRPPGPALVPRIVEALAAEGFPGDALGALDPADVTVAKTADRRVLGSMNDLAFTCELAADDAGGLGHLDVDALNHRLHRHLLGARAYVPAVELIQQRLS